MKPRERFLKALNRETPDRLPVTTHHVMPYFLNRDMRGMTNDQFFQHVGLDPIRWFEPRTTHAHRGDFLESGAVEDPNRKPYILNENWRVEKEDLNQATDQAERIRIITPRGELTTILQSNEMTTWMLEPLIKKKSDIALLGEFMPSPACDGEAVKAESVRLEGNAMLRGTIPGFDVFGQPGCWQDACCLFGVEPLIMETFDDPDWVHEFEAILLHRKMEYIRTLHGVPYDVLELGGGDASSTVISPKIFEKFVAPYDAQLIEAAHRAGQRISYHTCGGMMPILELIADMKPDAMETFTPVGMGGDTDLAEAKQRIGHRVCMIGGFDQFHYFIGCSVEETRREVRRCFEAAGDGGGFILAASDHFFEADPALLQAFADEARNCLY